MTGLKKEQHHLEEAATKLLAAALSAGAEMAEVCGSYGHRTKITLEKQDYHLASSDEGYQLGVRVLCSQRQGFASCNTTDAKDLRELALRAVEIAGFSPPNPNYAIAASENVSKDAPASPWDENLFLLSLQTQKDWTKMMVDEALKDPRFRMNEGTMGTSSGLYLVINSKGTHKCEREASIQWSLMGMAIEGETITSFDYFSDLSRQVATTPERILSTTRNFCNQVLQNLTQGPTKSYKGLVVFSPRAVCDIFLSSIAYHLNGRTLAEKTSRWQPGDLGKQAFDRRLTLRDQPWLSDRAGYGLFDREGTPTQNRTLIEDGLLRGWFLDHYSAKALELLSTGNAVGGPGSAPSVSPHSLVLAAGDESYQELLRRLSAQQDEFLVVHRYSGQSDPVTGDFSGVAKGGEWWHGGERRHAVKETLISGNVFEALGKAVFGVTKETEIIDSSEESPTLILDGISVTSG